MYSERELEQAAQFREEIHREALVKLRKVNTDIDTVVDRHPAEAYLQQVWDYPGAWYTAVSIPKGFKSRDALIDCIVRDTLSHYSRSEKQPKPVYEPKAKKPQEAAVMGSCPDDPFYALIAEYPDCVVEYCIVRLARKASGEAAHRAALACACKKLMDGGETDWEYDLRRAAGKLVDADSLFSSDYPSGRLNYRRAFLHPPHENSYTEEDFVRINRALFPNGTDELEDYEWTTDWSDYFDEGHEWWGALCITVYDKTLDRYIVLMASATD